MLHERCLCHGSPFSLWVSDCVDSFEEIHTGRLEIGVVLSVSGREWMWLWTLSEFVCRISFLEVCNQCLWTTTTTVYLQQWFYCNRCLCIYNSFLFMYLFTDECILSYIFDDGMWQMVLFQKGVWKFSPIPDVILLR